MSIYGMQLPKQMKVSKQLGPTTRNEGGASMYDSPIHNKTSSFQWTTYQRPRADHYQKIQSGKGTIFKNQLSNTGDGFKVTLRNTQHKFHSTGVRQQSFNDQNYSKLVDKSRFRGLDEETGMPQPLSKGDIKTLEEGTLYYDIKGNTFKDTLIPQKTAQSSFDQRKMTQTPSHAAGGGTSFSTRKPIKPKYKGYVRSGQILFNNINQVNTWDQVLPKATDRYSETRKSTSAMIYSPQSAQKPSTAYQMWVDNSGGAGSDRRHSQMQAQTQTKHKDLVKKSMDQKLAFSPDFKMKKLNMYDNTVLNVPRNLYEKCSLNKLYNANPPFNPKEFSQTQGAGSFINLGSQMGPGNRAVLYGSIQNNGWVNNANNSQTRSFDNRNITAKMAPEKDIKDHEPISNDIETLRKQQHYDSNIRDELVYRTRLLDRKHNEMDNRANSIKKYGYQPFYERELTKKRKVEGILLEQTQGKNPQERLPEYKRKFTPITSYTKKLYDSRITHLYGINTAGK